MNKVPLIDTNLFQHYLGDNDFSLCMKKKGVTTFIEPNSICIVDTATTGNNPKKNHSFRQKLHSFNSIRSTNNLKLRSAFGKKHCPKIYYPIYLISVIIQLIILNFFRK